MPRIWLAVACLALAMKSFLSAGETVVLLHGLARGAGSMNRLGAALEAEGYAVLNLEYPSRKFTVEELAGLVRERIINEVGEDKRIHLVTHSMGGILVRYMQQHFPLGNIGRVVMLSPPNQGSEVVDRLGDWSLFAWLNGPAGRQLGTSPDGLISRLGPVEFELGVITGDRSINWILSTMIPGPDDGKVAVARARVDGMKAFRVVHATHPFIMKNREAIGLAIAFLQSGVFPDGPSER